MPLSCKYCILFHWLSKSSALSQTNYQDDQELEMISKTNESATSTSQNGFLEAVPSLLHGEPSSSDSDSDCNIPLSDLAHKSK